MIFRCVNDFIEVIVTPGEFFLGMNDGAVVSEVMADLRIAAGGIGHDLRVGTDDTADEFSKIRLRVVLQQHGPNGARSEEHTSELQSLMRLSYAVFCLKKNKHTTHHH